LATLGRTISTHQNNYNSIRFVLAASVIYFHSFALTKAVGYADPLDGYLQTVGLSLGGLAVDCFFFLSGLFVTQSFYKDPSAINFAIRRFCRLWPGLFVCVAVTAVIACILSKGLRAGSFLIEPGFYHYVIRNSVLSLVWEIPGVFENRPFAAINGSIHTLPTEVRMYFLLLCARALMLLRRRATIFAVGAGIMLLGMVAYPFFMKHLSMPDYGLPPMAMFFAGVALFAIAEHVRINFLYPIGLLVLTLVTPAPLNTAFALATSAAAMIVFGQMRHGWRPRADVSYGVYIYGWPCQQFILTYFPDLNPHWLAVWALLLSIGFAMISWRVVEKPAISFGQSLSAAWTRMRSFGWAAAASQPITEWPRFAVMCSAFLAFLGMRLAVDRLPASRVSSLGVPILALGPSQAEANGRFNMLRPTGSHAVAAAPVSAGSPAPPGPASVSRSPGAAGPIPHRPPASAYT
jgi:peptidoglycan/LPS O-acetylase OafA/YrhL